MPAWFHERSTRGLDLLVLVSQSEERAEADRIVQALREHGFAHQTRVDRRRLEDGLLLHAWYPLREISMAIRVDLFLCTGGFRAEAIRRAVRGTVGGIEVPLATCEDLILLKCLAGMAIDTLDARALAEKNRAKLDLECLDRRARELGIVERPWTVTSAP